LENLNNAYFWIVENANYAYFREMRVPHDEI
jgi:hypothetical protein